VEDVGEELGGGARMGGHWLAIASLLWYQRGPLFGFPQSRGITRCAWR
jgi:hypothetical protein